MTEKFTEAILWKKGFRRNDRGEWVPGKTAAGLSPAIEKPHLRHEAKATDAGKKDCPGRRLRLVITSYRVKLCDIDNLEPKFLIDALRYAKIIVDDSPQDITELTLHQVKVRHRILEHTEIEIHTTN